MLCLVLVDWRMDNAGCVLCLCLGQLWLWGQDQSTPQPYPAAAFSSKQSMDSQPFVPDPVCGTESGLPLLSPREASGCAEPVAGAAAWLPITEGSVMTPAPGSLLWLSRPVKRHMEWDHDPCEESGILSPLWFLLKIPNFPWNLTLPGPSLSKSINTKGGWEVRGRLKYWW